MLSLLRLTAERVEHGAYHIDAERHNHRCPSQRGGVGINLLLAQCPPCTAMFDWPIGRDPTLAVDGFMPAFAICPTDAKT